MTDQFIWQLADKNAVAEAKSLGGSKLPTLPPSQTIALIREALRQEFDEKTLSVISAQDHVIRRLEREVEDLRIRVRDLNEAINKRFAYVEAWMHTHPGIEPNGKSAPPTITKPRKKRKARRERAEFTPVTAEQRKRLFELRRRQVATNPMEFFTYPKAWHGRAVEEYLQEYGA